MKKVLVTNDDGIGVRGLAALVDAMSDKYEVYAVAPAEQQSAKGMALTFMREISVEKAEVPGAKEAYIVDGTPVDCVMWAVPWFRERGIEFDYLFSGINLGANVGIAAYYSGTIGAARQGALDGVRSIAMSVGTSEARHFDYITSLIPRLMEIADTLSPSTILSVNAPDLEPWEVRGIRFAQVAPYGYEERYGFTPAGDHAEIPAGDITWDEPVNYQLGQQSFDGGPSAGHSSKIGPGMQSDVSAGVPEADLRYDLDCLHYGYAAITPLSTGNSDDVALRKLQGRFASEEALAVFIDVQENNASGIEMRNRFTGNIARFAACMRRLDMPVFITELSGYGAGLKELRGNLEPDRTDAVLRSEPGYGRSETVIGRMSGGGRIESVLRRELSAWGSGDFTRMMAAASVRKVLIAGLETHTAVLQTALDFVRRGYEVWIIEDCCGSRQGHDHKMAIERLRDAGCIVTTSRAAVMELVSTVNHPAAGAIQRILM